MIHLGIDHHKKYCHVVALNDAAEIVWDGRIDSERRAFVELKKQLPLDQPVQSVIKAGWNWGKLYDALHELGFNPKLANPLKTRLIAESVVKTDRIDALTHAQLLRAGMTPLVHVPTPEELKANALYPHVLSLPGVGPILGALIALEIGDIARFASAERLCSYSGLVSSAYSSGGKTRHGGTIPTSNAYLRFAYVEASWSAIRTSPYLRAFYAKQQREYIEKPYRLKSGRLGRS